MTTRKKKEQTEVPIVARLCVTPNKFRDDVEKRIKLGKILLEESIPSRVVGSYRGIYQSNRYPQKSEYDENAYNNWNNRYKKWHDYNVEYLRSVFDDPNNIYLKDYQQQAIVIWGKDVVQEMKENLRRQIAKLESLCEMSELFKLADNLVIKNKPQHEISNNGNVFIVHGHDGEIKHKVARMIGLLGLNPIILHEQPDEGMTIIEKLEHYAKEASFAVVLLTGDDAFGYTNDKGTIIVKRARQNVVFEMGYFMARLGRNRVFVIRDEESEKVGDIDGVIYTSTNGDWIMKMVKELKNAGYEIDANTIVSFM